MKTALFNSVNRVRPSKTSKIYLLTQKRCYYYLSTLLSKRVSTITIKSNIYIIYIEYIQKIHNFMIFIFPSLLVKILTQLTHLRNPCHDYVFYEYVKNTTYSTTYSVEKVS